jgi:prevent-host-death family protein
MRKVGSRELKNRLGWYLSVVRRGQSLLVTDRGKPIAKLSPTDVPDSEESELKNLLKSLETQGHLRIAKGSLGKFRAVKIKGKTASQSLLEDRR